MKGLEIWGGGNRKLWACDHRMLQPALKVIQMPNSQDAVTWPWGRMQLSAEFENWVISRLGFGEGGCFLAGGWRFAMTLNEDYLN